jgi:hypothetical protein
MAYGVMVFVGCDRSSQEAEVGCLGDLAEACRGGYGEAPRHVCCRGTVAALCLSFLKSSRGDAT